MVKGLEGETLVCSAGEEQNTVKSSPTLSSVWLSFSSAQLHYYVASFHCFVIQTYS